jgi:hypothetical protein
MDLPQSVLPTSPFSNIKAQVSNRLLSMMVDAVAPSAHLVWMLCQPDPHQHGFKVIPSSRFTFRRACHD